MMLAIAIAFIFGAAMLVILGVFRSRTGRLPAERRRPSEAEPATGLSRASGAITGYLAALLTRNGWSASLATALERAGLRMTPAELLVLTASGTLVALLIGFLLGGLVVGLLFALFGPVGARILLGMREARRRRAFANQLDDTLQLLAGGLRAGHSLLRSIDSVSREAESPTDEEFARIVNETRIGRDLNDSLEQSALRMRSEDFSWVAQAIAIHREVGGDLGHVLDEVGHTIRERNQIRRQVSALAAEGKMSAYILVALPFVVIGILMVTSPSYILKFVESPLGFIMMGAAAVMLMIGAIWMSKVVRIKF
ncbi:MAG: type II secretion system F family protein [Candidatus Saccharibacteria bacterium]|nr:type II secretion system F family protein [Microbacteriaceae bacterium]